jgi:hypothetical protein
MLYLMKKEEWSVLLKQNFTIYMYVFYIYIYILNIFNIFN